MPDPKLLEFSVQSFTADKLELKVKNISARVLEQTLAIELFIPKYLVNSKIIEAAKAAAKNRKPIGVSGLAGIVSGPESWSLWAKRESSDSSVVLLLLNDLTQAGTQLALPIKLAAGAEFIIGIPLNSQANRAPVHVLYSYQHGMDEDDQRGDGALELKADTSEPTPDVTLTTTAKNPTAIPPMNMVKIFWRVADGVSATLRGPLPGGNSELTLSSDPNADFKIADGFIEIRVVSNMTFMLQAEVKRAGKPNLQVVRMLSLDTKNNKYTYLSPRPARVLPYGLIEIDWAAWGVEEVQISVGRHTTRTIQLTQQTLGRFYEGSGVMRVSATKEINKVRTLSEGITLEAPPEESKTRSVEVISWIRMQKPNIGPASSLAVIAPKIAVLTNEGMSIAEVGNADRTPPLEKLDFSLKTPATGMWMWLGLAAVDQKFLCLRIVLGNRIPELEILPFTRDGNPDEIPPVTLPPEVRPVASSANPVFDFAGFGGRAYVVIESPKPAGRIRIAYSAAFDSNAKKSDLRREPLLEGLFGYRLVSFDNALFALNRNTGEMFRFDLSKTGTLEPPKKAASAVKKGEGGAKDQSMVKDGLLVPMGRLLVVMSPTAVPSVDSLERFGLVNTLNYTSTTSAQTDDLPQDLVYNPQKDYWSRCGQDLDVTSEAVAAYRGGDSKRLWVIQPDNDLLTLSVGSETLFAHDYVREFPTKPLPPYLNKTRTFKITNSTGMQFAPLSEPLRNAGLNDFGVAGPAELLSRFPETFRSGATEPFEFKYNDAEPAPITLRFQAQTPAGVKHSYLLEVIFSGPDLSTATSVFKRAKGEGNALAIAEIPETVVQHSTNNAIVIPPPKRLIEGVGLRAHNHTSYGIWKEAPEGKDQFERSNRYHDTEIKITYDTPAFHFLAYGAGELHVDVDFALPAGLEISPGNQPQRQLLRINTDKSNGFHADVMSATSQTSFNCKLTYLRKQELNGAYIGDGVAQERGEAIYLPIAGLAGPLITHVLKVNPDDLSSTQSAFFQSKSRVPYNAFAPPNSIALSDEYIFAMFADNQVQVLDFSLQFQDNVSVDDFTAVTAMKSQYDGHYFLVGMKQENAKTSYKLSSRIIAKNKSGPRKIMTGDGRTVSLDAVKGFREQNKVQGAPAWVSSKTVSPIAVSPSIVSTTGERGREVAVGIDGGLFVVGNTEQSIRTLALEAAGREEDIVFGRDGAYIYCLHSESDNINLRLSRVDNKALKQTHSLRLQTGQAAHDLAIDTRQQRPPGIWRSQRSISMVRTLDEKFLFVSHGRTIFRIAAPSLTLIDTFTTELPCRVFHVWAGQPTRDSHPMYGSASSCILLYAIGATYKGDGFDGRDFKTHLYKLGIPDR